MVGPLLPATGLLRGLLPEAPLSGIGPLPAGPAAMGGRDSEVRDDDALLVRLALQDPAVRAAWPREIARPPAGERRRRLGPGPGERTAREAPAALLEDDPVRAAAEVDAPGPANEETADPVPRASRPARSRVVSRLRLVLDPPMLGEVCVDLTVRGKVVYGAFQADAPGAAEALGSRLSELKEALERRGLRVGGLSAAAAGGEPPAPPRPFAAPSGLDVKA